MKTRHLGFLVVLGLASALCFGCPGDDPSQAPDGADAAVPETPDAGADAAARLEACGLAGRFRVAEVSPSSGSCGMLPSVGDEVAVGVDPQQRPVLRLEGRELALLPPDGSCVSVGEGCLGDEETFERLEVGLTSAGLRWRGLSIRSHVREDCPEESQIALERLADFEGCALPGSYQVPAAPEATRGACSFTWSAGPLVVSVDPIGAGLQIEWNGQTFAQTAFDPSTCTLSAGRGDLEAGDSPWIYNGAPRTVRIQLALGAQGELTGTIEDSIEGTTDFGEQCDATLSFEARRPVLGGNPMTSDCAAQPYACGDGACESERGESCSSCRADCGCASGTECVESACRARCTFLSPSCPPGERCDIPEAEAPYSATDRAYCGPAGAAVEGGVCTKNEDCAAGLWCHFDDFMSPDALGGRGLCLRPCDEDQPPAGCEHCERRANAFGLGSCMLVCDGTPEGACADPQAFCWDRYTNQLPYCWPLPPGGLPGLGEECDFFASGPHCKDALSCAGHNGRIICTHACAGDGDCPAELPVCSSGYCFES